jgi:hypothetical protein
MTSKQSNPADYAAAGFLSIQKEEERKTAVFFSPTGYGGKFYRL